MLKIKNENLNKAVTAITFQFANKKLDIYEAHAKGLCLVIEKLMIRRKVKDLYEAKDIVDIFVASAHLYKLFYQDNAISTLFLLREKTTELFNEYQVSLETQLRIFQMCECFMGEEALTEFLIPQKGYPDDLFADAIFIYDTWVKTND